MPSETIMIQGTQVSSTHWSIQRKCHSAIVNHGQDTGKTIQDTVKGQRPQQFYMSFTQEIYKVMMSMWKIFSLLKVHVYLEVGDVSHTSKKEQKHYVFFSLFLRSIYEKGAGPILTELPGNLAIDLNSWRTVLKSYVPGTK